jgi:hypothetical protein
MTRTFKLLFLLALLSTVHTFAAETDDEVAARRAVLNVVGAFQNDGFKTRDGAWLGQIAKSKLFAVNLYNGDAYWFSAGASKPDQLLEIDIFNEQGQPIASQHYQSRNFAAAGFSPDISGKYYVRVSADLPATVCLIYSYK